MNNIRMIGKLLDQNRILPLAISKGGTASIDVGKNIFSNRLPALIERWKKSNPTKAINVNDLIAITIRAHKSRIWLDSIHFITKMEVTALNLGFKTCFNSSDTFKVMNAENSEREMNDHWITTNIQDKETFLAMKEVIERGQVEVVEEVVKPKEFLELANITKQAYFYASPEHTEVFHFAALAMKKSDKAQKILMVGPSGWGKTSLPEHFASKSKLDFIRMDCALVRDPEEWFGFRGANSGTTTFEKSHFISAIERGNCVVVLDEVNRLEPWIANSLFPLLDHAGKATVYNQTFVVGPRVLFVGTVNLGFQYTGTFSLDQALLNRFSIIVQVGAVPSHEEKKILALNCGISSDDASKIVDVASAIRKFETIECSLRTTLQVGELVAAGCSIRSAFQHIVIARASTFLAEAETRSIIDEVNRIAGIFSANKTATLTHSF